MARHFEKMSKNESLWTVLSVQNPWSDLICRGIKDVENRSWPTGYRGRIYIHTSGAPMSPAGVREMLGIPRLRASATLRTWFNEGIKGGEDKPWLRSRAIIGHVDVIACIENAKSEWAARGSFHWVLANPFHFDEPVTDVPGRLRLWTFDPEKHREF